MDTQRGNIISSTENKSQTRPASYTVETPYGFHLDLDFLKYVDDIEKGITIRKVPMHRRGRGRNNGAFSRNLSLPGYGSKVKEWNSINNLWFRSKTGDSHQAFQIISSDNVSPGYSKTTEPFFKAFTCAEKDDSLHVFDERPLGRYVRPNLLRASSLPSTVLLRKQSESTEDPTSPREYLLDLSNSAEDVFHDIDDRKGRVNGTLQHLTAALKRVGELEEEIRVIPELKAQICILQEERERLLLQLESHNKTFGPPDFFTAPLLWDSASIDKEMKQKASDDWMNREYDRLEENLKASSEQVDRVPMASDCFVSKIARRKKVQSEKDSLDKGDITKSLGANHQGKVVLLEEKVHDLQVELDKARALLKHHLQESYLKEEKIKQLTLQAELRYTRAKVTLSDIPLHKTTNPDPFPTNQCVATDKQELLDQTPVPSSDMVHHVKRLQELLQEQWDCLCTNDSSGTLPPRVCTIQEQLTTLVTLLSLYVLPAGGVSKQDEEMKDNLAAVEDKPITEHFHPESIRDGGRLETEEVHILNIEERTREDSANKNTTGENDKQWATWSTYPADQKCGDTEFRPKDDAGDRETSKQNENRESVKPEFMDACCFLKDHMEKVEEPDDEMSRALTAVFQEWFHVSAEEGARADIVDLYLTEVNVRTPTVLQFLVNMVDDNGNTAMHYSVSHCNFSVVKRLLDSGQCDVGLRNKSGYTPVMLAAMKPVESSDDIKVVQRLIKLSDVNARVGQIGQTSLHLAARHGCAPVLRLLLVQGADANIQDKAGTTPLMSACERGHLNVVRILLEEAKCDVSLRDKGGRSALSLATQASHTDIADLLKARAETKSSDKCRVS